MLTLINSLILISQIQAAPGHISVNSWFLAEQSQFRWIDDPAEPDLGLAQVISIPDLPELEPVEPESGPAVEASPSQGAHVNSNGSHRGGGVRSGEANHRSRGDDDDDTPKRRRRDNDDDDDD